jgi:RNA polymerase sigma-70 factor (ECF subfamily)
VERDGGFEASLDRARKGDRDAFAWLWTYLNPSLLRYLTAGLPADADDIASSVWLEVARRIDRFEGNERAFRGWLFTIARHRLLDRQRQRQRDRSEPVPVAELAQRRATDDPLRIVLDLESTEAALSVVRRLPPDQADVVMLRVVAGLDTATVARVLGKRTGAVRVLQHRALRRLAEELGETPA